MHHAARYAYYYSGESGSAPENTVLPVISGTTTVGSELSTTNGTWNNEPDSYTYQWKRNGVNIASATNSTYTLVNNDSGTDITVTVTATNENGSTSATSAATNIPDSEFPLGFGANAIWINGRTSDGKTKTGPLGGVQVDSFVTNDVNALAFTKVGSINSARHPGKWIHCPGLQGYTCTDKAAFKFLHDGTEWDAFFRFYIYEFSTTSLFPFFSSNGLGGGKNGIQFSFDHRSASSQSKTWSTFWTNATTSVFNRSSDDVITTGAWVTAHVRYRLVGGTTKTLTTFIDGVQVDNATSAVAINTAVSTDNPTFFKDSDSASYGKYLMKHMVFIKGGMTAQETTDMYDYLEEGNESIYSDVDWVPSIDVDLHLMWGQSNMDNGATGPPAQLQTPLGVAIFANRDAVGTIEELDYPSNNCRTLGENAFGPELEYGRLIEADNPGHSLIYKYAVGGSTMHTSWNTSLTGNEQENFRAFMNGKLRDNLRWSYDANVNVIRINGAQGEADAHVDNPLAPDGPAIQAAYQSQNSALMTALISDCDANGWDTSEVEIVQGEISFGPTEAVNRPYQTEINNAITAVSDRVVETSDLGFSDDLHYNSAGTVTRGSRYFA